MNIIIRIFWEHHFLLYNYKVIKLSHFLILSIPLFYFGILTQSRSFLLAVFLLTVYMLVKNIGVKGLLSIPIVTIVVILISNMFQFTYLKIAWAAAFGRVLDPKNDDLSGGRIELWSDYLNSIFADNTVFLFGRGLELTHEKFGLPQVAHNFIIETIAGIGFLDSLIFLSFFVMLYFKFKNIIPNFKAPPDLFIPLVILISNSMTGHTFINMNFCFQFILWLLILGFCMKSIKKQYSSL